MTATPKTHATQVRKAAARKVAVTQDPRRLAYTSRTPDTTPSPDSDAAGGAGFRGGF